jgi:hypothetical protein
MALICANGVEHANQPVAIPIHPHQRAVRIRQSEYARPTHTGGEVCIGCSGKTDQSVIRVTGLRFAELKVEPSLFKCPTYAVSKAVALLFVAPPKFGTVPHWMTSAPV